MASEARYSYRISDAQRDAILKAHIIGGHRLADVRRMAETGQLEVPAFTIGTSIYGLVKRNKEAFEGEHEEALAASTRAELKRLHRLALAKSRALAKTTDVAEIARTAKALAETEKALNSGQRAKSANQRAGTEVKTPAQSQAETYTPRETTSVITTLLDSRTKAEAKTTTQGTRPGSLSDARRYPIAN